MKIVWLILKAILVTIQAIVSAFLVISLIRMGIIQTWIIVVVIAVLLALLVLNIVVLIVMKKAKIWAQVICVIIAVLCIGGGIFAYRYTDAFNSFLDRISSTIVSEVPFDDSEKDLIERPFVLYISGVDSRTGIDNPTALSDVNILMVINPKQSKILLASIPRDTYVQLHGTEGLKDKLTHAGMYGIEMSKTTIEDFLGITIDRTLKVSFDTVVDVVDELDGIEIYSDTAMNIKSERSGKICYFVEGKQVIDGECALRFSRERKTYYTGDKHRGANQQEVLTAIIQKISGSKEYLLKAPEILEVAADSFETSLSRDEITSFIRMQLNEPKNWQIESIAVDGEGVLEPTYSISDQNLYVMIPDEESLKSFVDKINEYLNE